MLAFLLLLRDGGHVTTLEVQAQDDGHLKISISCFMT